jgi:hypothetical protein
MNAVSLFVRVTAGVAAALAAAAAACAQSATPGNQIDHLVQGQAVECIPTRPETGTVLIGADAADPEATGDNPAAATAAPSASDPCASVMAKQDQPIAPPVLGGDLSPEGGVTQSLGSAQPALEFTVGPPPRRFTRNTFSRP